MMHHEHEGYWFRVEEGVSSTDIWLEFGITDDDDPDRPREPALGMFNLGDTLRAAADGHTTGGGLMRLSATEEAIMLRLADQLELYAAGIRSAMRGFTRDER